MKTQTISVVVADGQRLMAESLGGALRHYKDFEVAKVFPSEGVAAIEVIKTLRPDVALLDYWMPDIEGPAATAMILSKHPERKIILLSWFFGTRHIGQALEAGAVGFFPKSMGIEQAAEGIRRAAKGEKPVYLQELDSAFKTMSRREGRAAATFHRLEALSPRELQILTLQSLHLSNDEVAAQLNIGATTVKTHIRNILRKTGTLSSREAVNLAVSCGFIRP